MIKQLLVAALTLLLAAPVFAQYYEGGYNDKDTTLSFAFIHIGYTPAVMQPSFELKDLNQGYQYPIENGMAKVLFTPGTALNLYVEVHYNSDFKIVNWTDANGNVLVSGQMGMPVTITAAGDYYYNANFRFSPENPAFLPQGTYDQATATLTIYSPQPGYAMDSYMSLADRYNLPSEKDHHDWMMETDHNPLRTIIVSGYLESWEASNLCYNGNVRTLDMTGVILDDGYWPDYSFGWHDSLQVLKLPRNIRAIGENGIQYLPSLTDIYCYADTVPTVYPNSLMELGFYDDSTGIMSPVTLHVPMQSVISYQSDSIWGQFIVEGIPVQTTADISVYPGTDLAGLYIIVGRPGENTFIRQDIEVGKLRYDFPNMPLGDTYYVHLYTGNGFLADSTSFVLTENKSVHMSNETGLSSLVAHVSAGNTDISGQCLISWMDSTGTSLLQTGVESPWLPQGYKTIVHINPINELATYLEPKDTFAVAEVGHNGLWVTLDQKPVGGLDTVRIETGAVAIVVMTNGENGVALLYDSIGNLVAKSPLYAAAGRYAFAADGIPVGCYSLVTMREGQYSTLSRLDQYNQMGLVQGTDYILTEACIAPDSLTRVIIQAIPEEPQITNFLAPDAHFYVNKSEVMVAGQLILTAEVGFLEEYVDEISNVFYVIDLPENVVLIENSVLIGNSIASYSLQDNQLRVGVGLANLRNTKATMLRFCVAPTVAGDYYPSASVEFNYRNNAKAQPVSNTFFHSEAITIKAPDYTIVKNVTVTGFAPAFANVLIKTAEGETLANGVANGLGRYTIHAPFEAAGSRTLVLHAEASTDIVSGLISDTTSVFFDAEAASPTEIQITHFNKWYRQNMTINWNLNECTTNKGYYYYYLNADFTFTARFVGTTDSVVFVSVGQDGSRTQIPARNIGNGQWAATEYIQTYKVPSRVDLMYRVHGEMITFETCKSVNPIADPSGYVYEAVSSNRIQDVTAAAYMKYKEDELPILWDATPYDQINPQQTDEAGGYGWDVPAALWQVRFTKEGYQPAQTKWLPVPPPQMDVNMAMVRLSKPEVKSISAYIDNILIDFDRYMMLEDLTTQMIRVQCADTFVDGVIDLLNKEPRFAGDSISYASRVKFIPSSDFTSPLIHVRFGECRSYAGVAMDSTIQEANVSAEVKSFGQVDTLFLKVGESTQRTFYGLPAVASMGKTLRLDNNGSNLYSTSASSVVLANNGGATVNFTGLLPGVTELALSIDGTPLSTYVLVIVREADPIVTDVRNVSDESTTSTTSAAVKVLRDNNLFIEHNGNVYTTTGMMVE